jgi:hypothetical protein
MPGSANVPGQPGSPEDARRSLHALRRPGTPGCPAKLALSAADYILGGGQPAAQVRQHVLVQARTTTGSARRPWSGSRRCAGRQMTARRVLPLSFLGRIEQGPVPACIHKAPGGHKPRPRRVLLRGLVFSHPGERKRPRGWILGTTPRGRAVPPFLGKRAWVYPQGRAASTEDKFRFTLAWGRLTGREGSRLPPRPLLVGGAPRPPGAHPARGPFRARLR